MYPTIPCTLVSKCTLKSPKCYGCPKNLRACLPYYNYSLQFPKLPSLIIFLIQEQGLGSQAAILEMMTSTSSQIIVIPMKTQAAALPLVVIVTVKVPMLQMTHMTVFTEVKIQSIRMRSLRELHLQVQMLTFSDYFTSQFYKCRLLVPLLPTKNNCPINLL